MLSFLGGTCCTENTTHVTSTNSQVSFVTVAVRLHCKYTNVGLTLVVIVVVTHAMGISISFLFGNNLITHLQG